MENHFTVENRDIGQRLDKWLCTRLPGLSRNQIKSLLDDGRILINNRRVVIAGWELEADDVVEVRIPPDFEKKAGGEGSVPSPQHAAPASPVTPDGAEVPAEKAKIRASIERHFTRQKDRHHRKPEETKKENKENKEGAQSRPGRLKIYHEDRDLIVVEKLAGLLSVASQEERGSQDLVREIKGYMRRRHRGSQHSFVAPLHRLDAETSGIMVFALSREGQKLEHQFRDHSIRREYTAIAAGRLEEEKGIIDIPLEKGDFHGGKKVRSAEGGGKRAVTEFSVKERYRNATLLELRVRTGRTHQIRVHLAEKGFPLIGDKLYADRVPEGIPPFSRHALHAHSLGFRHPATGKKLTFHSPLPRDMRELIDKLREAIAKGE
ncbi:MAG: RluA family pseudouridine synthase [Pseudomonadota bacterium]